MSRARIQWISGPVLRAVAEGPFRLREAVEVGPLGLLGEVIRLDGDRITAQVYEPTVGLKPGISVRGSGELLSVRVGPHLLGRMFDGLLRPLGSERTRHVHPGAQAAARLAFAFRPRVASGDLLEPGSTFGDVELPWGSEVACLLPPQRGGEVESVRPEGEYADDAPLVVLRDAAGRRTEVAMSHRWPVRVPRPVKERIASDRPLVTGQRLLDSLFPIALGSKSALPGGFGTGKTVLLETLAKSCAADVIVYLGCGERGNEIAGVLDEFPGLKDPRTGRSLMERTVIIANTSNMAVAAREASVYTAMTVAEYFRDQGLDVALMADSTSRWAEALREVSGLVGELPGEGGYPAYLAGRIADFYERAARVRTLSGTVGSVTVLGSISPPSGDFSEPVTSHTTRYVRDLWALDTQRAQARFYPAINPLKSYSEDAPQLAMWWDKVYADLPPPAGGDAAAEWMVLRRRFLTLLEEQIRVERMARIVGKDALPARQRLTLLAAELVNEAFLRQSAFSENDRHCSPDRQAMMMRLLVRFISLAESAVGAGVKPELIGQMPVLRRLQRMGEDLPDGVLAPLSELEASLEADFLPLLEPRSEAHAG